MVELAMKEDNVAHVSVGMDIVSDVVTDLKAALDGACKKGCAKVLVNMKGVEYINSSGLSILVGVHTKLKKENGALRLVNVSQDLFDFFQSIGLPKVFEIEMQKTP